MQRSFLSHLSFILLLNLLIKPAYLFGVEVNVQNRLGVEMYGIYFAILNSAYLFQIINDFGIQIFNNRQVAGDRSKLQVLLPGLTLLKLVLALVFAAIVLITGILLGYSGWLLLLAIITGNLVLTSFILFFRSGISGLGLYRTDSILSVLDKCLMLIFIGTLLIVLRGEAFTVYHFAIAQGAALMLTVIVCVAVIVGKVSFSVSYTQFDKTSPLLRAAWPFAVAIFLMTIYTRIDAVMIKSILPDGDAEAGIYAAGYRILDAFNMLAFLFAVMLLPMFRRNRNNLDGQRILADQGLRYMIALAIPAVVVCVAYRHEIIHFLYTAADAYWSAVFGLLIVNALPIGLMYVFGTYLTAVGSIRTLNIVYLTTVAINIALNLVLIPEYAAWGAALATLCTQSFATLSLIFLSIRLLIPSFSASYISRLGLYFILCICAGFATVHVLPMPWYFGLALLALICIVLSLWCRIISLREIRTM